MMKPEISHYFEKEKDRPNPFILVLIGIWVALAGLGVWKLVDILKIIF